MTEFTLLTMVQLPPPSVLRARPKLVDAKTRFGEEGAIQMPDTMLELLGREGMPLLAAVQVTPPSTLLFTLAFEVPA